MNERFILNHGYGTLHEILASYHFVYLQSDVYRNVKDRRPHASIRSQLMGYSRGQIGDFLRYNVPYIGINLAGTSLVGR